MNKGYLVVLTGIDGSGKTTQAELLIESLKQDGVEASYVWSRWKPFLLRPLIRKWKVSLTKDLHESEVDSDKMLSKKHKLLMNPLFRWIWLTSFFIDYGLQIFLKIRIKLINKRFIVSDRMVYDSVIDQAINLGKRKDWLLDVLNSFWIRILFPSPDIVVYVDCPGDIAFLRKYDAPNVEYLIERRKLYLNLSKKHMWDKVDGTLPVHELAGKIKQLVYEKLGFLKE